MNQGKLLDFCDYKTHRADGVADVLLHHGKDVETVLFRWFWHEGERYRKVYKRILRPVLPWEIGLLARIGSAYRAPLITNEDAMRLVTSSTH